MIMKSIATSSSSGKAASIKEEQGLEAPKLKLAKSLLLDTMEKELVTLEDVKENDSVVKDLPCALESLNELFSLSAALSNFTCQFNELQQHMESIAKSIDSLYKQKNINESEVVLVVPEPNVPTSPSPGPPVSSSSNQIDKPIDNINKLQNVKESEVALIALEPNASTLASSASPVLSLSNPVARSPDNGRSCKKASCTNLEALCRDMCSRGFRKYIQSHISDIEKIREEATTALTCAPDPSKFVLKSIGKFYLESSRTYLNTKNSTQISFRQASLFILEFFLLSNCTYVEPSIKKEAEHVAIVWRTRVFKEGGLSNASTEDARGLLLLLASYGVPSDFNDEDLIELIHLSKAREISNALGRSQFLTERICDIIQGMVEKKMYMPAVEVAYSVGIQEKFPPERILSSFLQEAKDACKVATSSKCSPEALKEANEKKLASFRTVAKCLEDYKIAPTKLAGCNIHAEIDELEKVISDLDSAIGGERKAYVNHNNVIEFGRQKSSHVKKAELGKGNSDLDTTVGEKRKAYVNNNVIEFGSQQPWHVKRAELGTGNPDLDTTVGEKRKACVINNVTPFVRPEAKLPRTSSVVSPQMHNTSTTLPHEQKAHDLHRPPPGNFAEASAVHAAGSRGAFHRTVPHIVPDASVWHAAGAGGVFNVAPPVHSASGGAGPHAWHGDGALNDNSLRHDFIGNLDRSLPRPTVAMQQGFPGHPSTSFGAGNRNPSASLYQFADSF